MKVRIRILSLLLCLTVLFSSVSALGETTKTTARLLRLREGPSTSSKVLDAYPKGTKVTILKKGDTWTKVQVHGKTGYMMTSMLAYGRDQQKDSDDSGSSGKSSGSSLSSGSAAYVMKGVRLNLRDEPKNSGEIIGSFRGGTKVTILKKGKYWCYVEVKGLTGYMGTDYLTDVKEK